MSEKQTAASVKKQPPPPQADVAVEDNPWHPMSTAPKDGSYVFLKGDPCADKDIENHWYFYRTRQYLNHHWMPTGWWRRRFGPNAQPSFPLTGWRSIKEGLPE